jgi:hypothetical protein
MPRLRSLARPVLAPVGHRLDRGTETLVHLIHAVKNEFMERLDEVEANTGQHLGLAMTRITALEAEVGAIRDQVDGSRELLEHHTRQLVELTDAIRAVSDVGPVGARLDQIDAGTAAFLNYVESHTGPLADAGLWINHPLWFEWSAGQVRLGSVNERIVEQPFVLRAIGRLPAGARVLDIGGGESTMGFQLASLGYRTTVLEPRGYPFRHPNLTEATEPIERFDADEPFDAVILLSTIEHLGVGHYGDGLGDDADRQAMERIRNELLTPGGMVVVTTPYGPFEITPVERIYDRQHLMGLLDGWTIQEAHVASRSDERTWELIADELVDPAPPGSVALLVATADNRDTTAAS